MPFKIETVYVEHKSEDACISHIEKCKKSNPVACKNMNYHFSDKRGWRTFYDLEIFVSDKEFYDVTED